MYGVYKYCKIYMKYVLYYGCVRVSAKLDTCRVIQSLENRNSVWLCVYGRFSVDKCIVRNNNIYIMYWVMMCCYLWTVRCFTIIINVSAPLLIFCRHRHAILGQPLDQRSIIVYIGAGAWGGHWRPDGIYRSTEIANKWCKKKKKMIII